MTDAELLADKLTKIGACLRELRTLTDLDRLRKDVKEERFVARTLQLTVQAALDAASHIVSDDPLGEPETNEELFTLLERNGWIAPGLAAELRSMARFRNLLVHDYARIDLEKVEDIVRNHLAGLEAFVGAVRAKLP